MTVGTEFYNWADHTPAPDPKYNHCSPNLAAIWDYMAKRWACTDIGCYGVRPIRGGIAWSTHTWGAARDIRYDHVGRAVALNEILPWLIDNSEELHIQAIHDYIGCRIYRAGRGWKAQTPSSNGMGQAWASYFHIETTPEGWGDATPVDGRLSTPDPTPPDPTPVPPSPPGGFVHTTVKLGDTNEAVYAVQMFCKKVAGNTDIVVDGDFGPVTEDAVRKVQNWYGLTADGIVGPISWGKIDQIVNA